MASVDDGNEKLVEQLKARGDVLSLAAAAEIQRLLDIWEGNNEIFASLFEHHILVQVSEPHGLQSS